MANGIHSMQTKSRVRVATILKNWPFTAASVARDLIKRYDRPHEVTEEMMLWHYNGPWLKTVVWRGGAYHAFPTAHVDLLQQTLALRVPREKIPALAEYSPSLSVNEARDELTVCCANEVVNFVTVNLAYDIIIGQISPSQARQRHAEMIEALKMHWPEPYSEGLQFALVETQYGTGESDESVASVTGPFRRGRHFNR